MKKTITLLSALLPFATAHAAEPSLSPEMVTAAQVASAQATKRILMFVVGTEQVIHLTSPRPIGSGQKIQTAVTLQSMATGGVQFLSRTCSTLTHRKASSSSAVNKPLISRMKTLTSPSLQQITGSHTTTLSGATIL